MKLFSRIKKRVRKWLQADLDVQENYSKSKE